DPKQLELAVATSPHPRGERLAVKRMHREQVSADARYRGGGALDRRFDIEQLRVDKDAITPRYELARKFESAGKQEFKADLIHPDAALQRVDHRPTLLDPWHVERDD